MRSAGHAPAVGEAQGPVSGLTENDLMRRLIWSGLLAGTGALASLVAHRLSAFIWVRLFKEEPPE